MFRHYQSQGAHKQFAPYQSGWKRFLSNQKKKRAVVVRDASNNERNRANPFFKRQEKGGGSRRIVIILIVAIFVVVAWFATLVYLPYFRIIKTNFIGLQVIKKDEIDADIRGQFLEADTLIPQNNYFFLSTKSIEKYLTQNYSLSSVTIKKEFPDKIIVDLEEKISTVIYDNGQEYYLLDQNARVVRMLARVSSDEIIVAQPLSVATSTIRSSTTMTMATGTARIHLPNYKKIKSEFGPFPIIYDSRLQVSTTSGQILPPDLITGVINFYTQAEKQGIATIKYLVLDTPLAGIMAKTDKPWDVYFQPLDNIGAQLSNLKLILKANKPGEYIDLRYGGRVYWK